MMIADAQTGPSTPRDGVAVRSTPVERLATRGGGAELARCEGVEPTPLGGP